jgi:hypothetical protein
MIQIQLQQRGTRYRWLGICLGLALAITAFGGALYSLDRTISLRSVWARWTTTEPPSASPVAVVLPNARQDMSTDLPISVPVAAPTVHGTTDLLLDTQAASRSLALVARLPASFAVLDLSVSASGVFSIVGQLDPTSSLAGILELLRPDTFGLRGTRWSSDGSNHASCRLVGRVVSSGSAREPVSATEAQRLFALAETQAAASGLQSVVIGAYATRPVDEALSLRQIDLTGSGSYESLTRFMQSLADRQGGVRAGHLDVVRSPDTGDNHFTLSLDVVVSSFDVVVREIP